MAAAARPSAAGQAAAAAAAAAGEAAGGSAGAAGSASGAGASRSKGRKDKVAYFFDETEGNYYYGQGHPMKPHRMKMAHSLVVNYGLYRKMEIFRPRRATELEMTRFHSDDYVDFLRLVTPDNMEEHAASLQRFNVGEDCPVFDGMYQFCQLSAGGSLGGAMKLNANECDVAVNWAGGLHHAKKSEASGFCYVNDIVLAILELLKVHQRVLYIDIDIHHGDGVEEAFYTTDRVLTLSLHKFGDYFPGTGDVRDTGAGKEGKYHSINFPLQDGVDDASYAKIFEPIMDAIMSTYQPGAIALQCGADSLAGDRLGCFNLSSRQHGRAVEYVLKFGVPVLVLGGGGYTIRNVARCWAHETAVVLGTELCEDLPYNDYLEYYGPDYKLHVPSSNMENCNPSEYLARHTAIILDNIRRIGKPNAGTWAPAAPDAGARLADDDRARREAAEDAGGDAGPDAARRTPQARDASREHDGALSDSDDEDGDRRRDHHDAAAADDVMADAVRQAAPATPADSAAAQEAMAAARTAAAAAAAAASTAPAASTAVGSDGKDEALQ